MNDQWIRKIGLFLAASPSAEQALDLSAFHIKFEVQSADIESPNTANIRVYNLNDETIRQIRGEYQSVILNAGYERGNYGIIFQGTIKQFRIGRESSTDTYLDILAADGDIGYNQGVVASTLRAGTTPEDAIATNARAMGLEVDTSSLVVDKQHIPSIRGSVQLGMARARMRNWARHLDAGWSIQNGVVVVTNNTGYRNGEVVDINMATGMIGLPEQTDGGIKVKCLLNSRLRLGSRVRLNNADINQLYQRDPNAGPVPYNQWAGLYNLAPTSADGVYRLYGLDHGGDTRGLPWYSELILLAVNETTTPTTAVSGAE